MNFLNDKEELIIFTLLYKYLIYLFKNIKTIFIYLFIYLFSK